MPKPVYAAVLRWYRRVFLFKLYYFAEHDLRLANSTLALYPAAAQLLRCEKFSICLRRRRDGATKIPFGLGAGTALP
jgi:hypothetical protein